LTKVLTLLFGFQASDVGVELFTFVYHNNNMGDMALA